LAGVGETKAKAIVAYRDANGPFASVDELLEVKGIGKAILDRNRDKLEVN
jgi:competence protein ComEA